MESGGEGDDRHRIATLISAAPSGGWWTCERQLQPKTMLRRF
jgi:hypothetical protein